MIHRENYSLEEILRGTISSDNEDRNMAENLFLVKINEKDQIRNLMNLIHEENNDVAFIATVQLGNIIKTNYKGLMATEAIHGSYTKIIADDTPEINPFASKKAEIEPSAINLCEEDRLFLRESILESLMMLHSKQEDTKFNVLLTAYVTAIENELPGSLSELLPQIQKMLTTEEFSPTFVALKIFKKIFKVVTEKSMLQFIQECGDLLQAIEGILARSVGQSESDILQVKSLAISILSKHLVKERVKLLMPLLSKEISYYEQVSSEFTDNKHKEIMLDASKRVVNFFSQVAIYYGTIDECEYDAYPVVYEFTSKYFVKILQFCFQCCEHVGRGSEKLLIEAIKFITNSFCRKRICFSTPRQAQGTKHEDLLTEEDIFKPCCDLIQNSLLKYLMLTKNEETQFSDNPTEFFNLNRTDAEDIETVRNVVIDLIIGVTHFKNIREDNYPCMEILFEFCYSHIVSMIEDETIDYRQKDVLITMFACLASKVVAVDYELEKCHTLLEGFSKFLLTGNDSVQDQILKYRILCVFEDYKFISYNQETMKNLCYFYSKLLGTEQEYSQSDEIIQRSISYSNCLKIQAAKTFAELDSDLVKQVCSDEILKSVLKLYIDLICLNNTELLFGFQAFMENYSLFLEQFLGEILIEMLDRAKVSEGGNKYGYLLILSLLMINLTCNPPLLKFLLPNFTDFFKDLLQRDDEDSFMIIIDCLSEVLDSLDCVPIEICSIIPTILKCVYHQELSGIARLGFNHIPQINDLVKKVIKADPEIIFEKEFEGTTIFQAVSHMILQVYQICTKAQLVSEAMSVSNLIADLLDLGRRMDVALPDFVTEMLKFIAQPFVTLFHKKEITIYLACMLEANQPLVISTVQNLDTEPLDEFVMCILKNPLTVKADHCEDDFLPFSDPFGSPFSE
ncbi:unnamed protein product [Moneuplotes crassus]|uniref:Uncharacterized protein n=1 Tax=Euplotes crassus TaxID=5936 RepID=A0AAD2D5M5_EUPCR|nr:unnamed protein product [Moneuplotes crassus]